MAGSYSHTTRADGLTLTAAIYNADHQNHIDNHIPSKMDDASSNVAAMQATTDPGEVGTESLPTTLAGELERLRFMIADITGKTQWYETPASTIATLDAALIEAGTDMLFYQTAAPTGWTKNTTAALDDHALRVVTSTAWTGGTQGTNAFSTQFASLAESATPGIGDHALTEAETGAHDHHVIGSTISSGLAPDASTYIHVSAGDAQNPSGVGFAYHLTRATVAPTTGLTSSDGGGSGHSHTIDLRVKYLDMIIASKD